MSPQVRDKLSLKVMINKKKQKLLFAEANSDFADILLSFLTLPLGRILGVFEKHYGDGKAPKIGSSNNLYRSLTNLDSSHFVSKYSKKKLLNPTSSLEGQYHRLKLNMKHKYAYDYDIDDIDEDDTYEDDMWDSSNGAFVLPGTSFIISPDLQIFPNDKGVFGVITFLGITDMDEAELVKIDFGRSEMLNLLKASLTSSTPLSDIVLKKTNYESRPMTPILPMIEEEKSVVSLKVMIQRSTGKFLSAQAKPDFIKFLCGLFSITLGGLEQKLPGTTCFNATKNLYRSTSQIDCKYFKRAYTKERLMKLKLPHDFISRKTIFRNQSRTYEVADDLTVKPFCIVSILSRLKEQKIPMSDMEEVELQIGVKKGLRIMVASLTSNSVISDALLSDEIKANKRVKREVKKEVI